MSTGEDPIGTARVRTVEVTADFVTGHLTDGRIISVPLSWSWRLSAATPTQRNNYRLIADGIGIHWPDVDEDISVRGMLLGSPAPVKRKT